MMRLFSSFNELDGKKETVDRKKSKSFKALPLLFALIIFSFLAQGSFLMAQQGKIVYISNQMGSWDIWIMNADGSDKTRLTFDDATNEHAPRFSPDGKKIAFNWIVGNESRLMVMDRDGSNATCVRTYPWSVYFYEWSASDWLCLAGNSRPGCFMDDLRLIRPDGSDERILLQNVPSHGAAVTPDGQSILYVKSVYCWTPYNQIRMMDIDGSNDRLVFPNDRKAEFWPSYFNQDPRQFVFHQSDSSRGYGRPLNLYTMNDDGTGKTRVTNLTGDYAFMTPIMSNDDSKILCSYNFGNNSDIVIVDRDSGNFTNLTSSPYRESYPDWYESTCSFGPADQPLVFERGKGKPIIENVNWESCGGNGKMKIACHRTASAHIYLNGAEIVSPQMLNNNTKILEIPIILEQDTNILQVKVEGKPTGTLEIEFIEE
jgi:Tol biopolymer transport system component